MDDSQLEKLVYIPLIGTAVRSHICLHLDGACICPSWGHTMVEEKLTFHGTPSGST